MYDYRSLNYADISLYLSSYPPDAPILVDVLSEEDTSGGFDIAPLNVGESLAHVRAMPKDGYPLIPINNGLHEVIGVLFALQGPLFILAPAREH